MRLARGGCATDAIARIFHCEPDKVLEDLLILDNDNMRKDFAPLAYQLRLFI